MSENGLMVTAIGNDENWALEDPFPLHILMYLLQSHNDVTLMFVFQLLLTSNDILH